MKNLKEILKNTEYELIKGNLDIEIKDLRDNSKLVEPGDMFIAIVGTAVDSHNFIPNAIASGASAIIVEKDIEIFQDVTVIKVESSRKALASISAAYFDYPSKKLTTIGITGTCGKTSTSYILKGILEASGKKVGLIGTICALIGDRKVETHNTTPSPYELQKLFYEMVNENCGYVIMEVSSQGLKMDRVYGIQFDYAIFTNLSMDHIGPNEHESFEEYMYFKSLLFKQSSVGIINVDSPYWQNVTKDHTCDIIKFGLNNDLVDNQASNINFVIDNTSLGVSFDVSGNVNDSFYISIPGRFSVYNALAAITVANKIGIDDGSIKLALKNVNVLGRMELVVSNSKYKLIVDYAHNRDEMDNLMETISEYDHKRLICIFGGGGNRAKDRRYSMGEVAGKWADLTILTEDNPRFEDIKSINNDIKVGLDKYDGKYIEIKDRKEAIKYAIENAEIGDIILLIGKGHERYQEIQGVKHFWDERLAIKEIQEELLIRK